MTARTQVFSTENTLQHTSNFSAARECHLGKIMKGGLRYTLELKEQLRNAQGHGLRPLKFLDFSCLDSSWAPNESGQGGFQGEQNPHALMFLSP